MYMNPYQKYMKDLLSEYGPLLKRQLMQFINLKFSVKKKNIDGYISQMCIFEDYKISDSGEYETLCPGDEVPDYDVIRSVDVLLEFMKNVCHHRKGKGFISIVFVTETAKCVKEFFILPVKGGMEKVISSYANDKFLNKKSEVAIFLLEDTKQIKLIHTNCNHNFAMITKDGVKFLKENN